MTKNIIFRVFVFIVLHIHGNLASQNVSQNEAILIAKAFFNNKLNQTGNCRDIINPAGIENKAIDGNTLYYMVNFEQGGYVVLSANKKFYPVLAYSFEGNFKSGNIPDNCKTWVEAWESQMINAFQDEDFPTMDNSATWNMLASGKFSPAGTRGVQHLLTSSWSQTPPHNQMCPADPDGFSGHTPVGCVALAMSQLMYYYRFPESGAGTVLYTPPYQFGVYGAQYVNFEEALYDWPAMTDICRETNDAIAMLCYHAGVSIQTAYMPESSGANINNVSAALTGHFNYLADEYLARTEVPNTSDWTALLIQNLENNQPVLYRSSSGFGGHVYICDGYQDSTHFHFNWGWGGAYNGYYYIDNLTPGGIQINYAHGAIFNIYPDTTQFEFPDFNTDNEILTNNVGSFEDGSANLNYLPETQKTWLIQPADPEITNILLEFSFLVTEAEIDIIRVYDGNSAEAPLLTSLGGNDFPVSVTSTGPGVFVTFESDSQHQFEGFHANYYGYHLPFCEPEMYLTDPTGGLEDGSRFHQYINNSDCEWVIAPEISPQDSIAQVILHFYQLQLAAGDTLSVYDGKNKQGALLGKFVGGYLPGDLMATGNKIFLNFTTDTNLTDQGWTVGWDYILPEYCSDTIVFTATEDTIADGSGLKKYIENSDCFFYIEPDQAESITIGFADFEIEPNYDYLEVFNPENLTIPLDKHSGFELPQTKTYPYKQLLLHFHSDYRDNFQGWKLYYQADVAAISEYSSGIAVYPNPASDFLFIDLHTQNNSKINYQIYNANGALILTGLTDKKTTSINLNTFKDGLYYLFIKYDETILSKKIMKL